MESQYKKDAYSLVENYMNTLPREEQKEFKKALKKYFSYPRWNDLKRRLQGADSKGQARERHNKEMIKLLHFGFGLPYEGYLEKEEVITRYSPKTSSILEFEYLGTVGKTEKDASQYARKYVNLVSKYIEQAKDRIWVYEYLGKGRRHLPGFVLGEHYSMAHDVLFSIVEDRLRKNPKMKYVRLLTLPISTSYPYENSNFSEKDKFRDALIECSYPVFTHICRCLKNHENQAGFYIVWIPTRIYHYGILDRKYLLTEYYRYNRDFDFNPDVLYVEKIQDDLDSPTQLLLDLYQTEIKAIIEKGSPRGSQMDKADFIEAANNAIRYIEDQIPEKKKTELMVWKTKQEVMKKKIEAMTDLLS